MKEKSKKMNSTTSKHHKESSSSSSENDSEDETVTSTTARKKEKRPKKYRRSSSDSESDENEVKRTEVFSSSTKKQKKTYKKKSSDSSSSHSESSSSSSSSSSSDRDSNDETVTSTTVGKRDSWMNDETFVHTLSKEEMFTSSRQRRADALKEQRAKEEAIKKQRELNPHMKNEASGFRDDETTAENLSLPSTSVGDGGYSWLKKAYYRIQEQAQQEGRPMEEVAVERWGSLDKLVSLIKEAEDRMKDLPDWKHSRNQYRDKYESKRRSEFKRPNSSESVETFNRPFEFRKPTDENRDRKRVNQFKSSRKNYDDHDYKYANSYYEDSHKESEIKRGSSSGGSSRIPAWKKQKYSDDEQTACRKLENKDYRDNKAYDSSSKTHFDKDSETKRSGSNKYSHILAWEKHKHSDEKYTASKSENKDYRDYRSHVSSSKSSLSKDVETKKSDSSDYSHIPAWKKTKYSEDKLITSTSENKEVYSDNRTHTSSSRNSEIKSQDSDKQSRIPAWKKAKYIEDKETAGESENKQSVKNTIHVSSSKDSEIKSGDFDKQSHIAAGKRHEYMEDKEIASISEDKKDNASNRTQKIRLESSKTSSNPTALEVADKTGDMPAIYNFNDLNMLGGRQLRAEFYGHKALAEKLQKQLEEARKMVKEIGFAKRSTKTEEVILSKYDSRGQLRPIETERRASDFKNKKINKKYFDDGSCHSLKQMFEKEKMTTVDDQMEMFVEASAQSNETAELDYESGHISKKLSQKLSSTRQEERDIGKAIQQHQKLTAALEKCYYCIDQPYMKKHLLVDVGENVYLCLPNFETLAEGHCLIVPKNHVSSFLSLDENEWEEVNDYKNQLRNVFRSEKKSVVFLETSMHFKYFPHAVLECIPVPEEEGDMAPFYFKKAIQESETEWANNKKLIDLKNKGLRHSVPKGLPYFYVEFDPKVHAGYAHVIENERLFPRNFGKEVVGGMLDIDYNRLYKNKRDDAGKKSEEVAEFKKKWNSFKK